MEYNSQPQSLVLIVFRQILMLVIPLILFFTSLDTITDRDKAWYGGGYDPEYAYLFNSMNMANLEKVGHFDHPGTPTQVFGGIVLRITWLVQPAGENPTDAVIFEPEHYLRILTIATLALAVVMIFIFGLIVLERSDNPGYALLVQLAPFISGFVLFNGFTRFTQESMLMIASLGYAVALTNRLVNHDTENEDKSFLTLGLIAGFGMATKILFTPLMMIPLIIAKSNKLRRRFLYYSALSFMLFTLPIVMLYPRMAYWMIKLLVFSGQYGTGPPGIIDTVTYPQHLIWILQANPLLTGFFIIGLIYLATGSIFLRKQKGVFPKEEMRLISALLFAIAAGYLIVAKSPKEAYLLPYEMLVPVFAIVLMKGLSGIRVFRSGWKLISVIIVAGIALFVIPYGIANKESLYSSDKNALWETSFQAAFSQHEMGGVVVAHPASSQAAAVYFGNAYSRWKYTSQLRQFYPDTYIFDLAGGGITQMDSVKIGIKDLLVRHKMLYIYGPLESEIQLRTAFSEQGATVQHDFYYKDDKQIILLAQFAGPAKNNEIRTLLFSSAETNPGKPDEPLKINGIAAHGKTDSKVSLCGRSSIITWNESRYAFKTEPVSLQYGDSISARVFVNGKLDDARLIIAEYGSERVIAEKQPLFQVETDSWTQLQAGFRKTEGKQRDVVVYGWNNGSGEVWFDEFSVQIIRAGQ